MTAPAVNQQVLDWLAAGDEVNPQESVKELSRKIAVAIDEPVERPTTDEHVEQLLARVDEPCEELLAAVFPVLEYAGEQAFHVVGRGLLHIAERTTAASEERGWNARFGLVAVGRLVWAITAFAIHGGRWNAIAELSRASVRVPFREGDVEPLIALHQLHYPEVLGGNAGNAYRDYRDWLLNLALPHERYPLFETEAGACFDEADLLLALKAAAERRRVYCESANVKTVRRLALDAADPRHRAELAVIFRTEEGALNGTLEESYGRLETNQYGWDRPPPSLFGSSPDD